VVAGSTSANSALPRRHRSAGGNLASCGRVRINSRRPPATSQGASSTRQPAARIAEASGSLVASTTSSPDTRSATASGISG
jgi:hypothetical protein